jgi:hypothetical protein
MERQQRAMQSGVFMSMGFRERAHLGGFILRNREITILTHNANNIETI